LSRRKIERLALQLDQAFGDVCCALRRLLKKAHLRRWSAWALVAAYQKYALTHLRWVPRPLRSA